VDGDAPEAPLNPHRPRGLCDVAVQLLEGGAGG
jgi:hypothetical protein